MKAKHCAAALASLMVAAQADAEVVSYTFTAVVSSLFEHDSETGVNTSAAFSDFSGTRVSVGDVVHGQFSFNTNAPLGSYQPEAPAVGAYHLYRLDQADASFSFSLGSSSFNSAPWSRLAQVANDATTFGGWDIFHLSASMGFDTEWSKSGSISLFDKTSTAFTSAALPSLLSLDNFFYKRLEGGWLRRADGDQMNFQANLVSLQAVIAVPEPATYAMTLAGLLAIAIRARKKSGLTE